MSSKILYPITAHISLCILSFIVYNLFLMGPEGGILSVIISQRLNVKIASVVMFCVAVIGLSITIITYFKLGRLLSFESNYIGLHAIISVFVVNILIFVFFIIIFEKSNGFSNVEYYSKMTFNVTFFPLLVTLEWKGIISVVVTSFFPSIIMFLGYLYPFKS